MTRFLRIIGWMVIIGGPVTAVVSSLQMLSAFSLPQSPPLPVAVFVSAAAALILGAAQPIAVGGGLLVILDIDERTRRTSPSEG